LQKQKQAGDVAVAVAVEEGVVDCRLFFSIEYEFS
jgi:hypothetical protein